MRSGFVRRIKIMDLAPKSVARRDLVAWSLGAFLLLMIFFYAGQAFLNGRKQSLRLTVYAFSTQEEVLTQAILPAFEAAWEAEHNRALVIDSVFGPSGTLAGQINLGAPADVALLSNAQHVDWLKVGRKVRWRTAPLAISDTPMVIVTRPGNPAAISTFSDLARPGLRLLHADPRQSGAGAWAVLAEYGSARLVADAALAESQLVGIWQNVVCMGPSARATLTLFELGIGDALITYEQDARLAQARGVPLEIVLPPRTIVARHVAVVVDENVSTAERPVAEALLAYLMSEAGQQALLAYHLRPAGKATSSFPPLLEPFTVEMLGGWSEAYSEVIEQVWEAKIEPDLDLAPLSFESSHPIGE